MPLRHSKPYGPRLPVDRVALIGTRLGGLVAASIASEVDGPLALLGPRRRGATYFEEQIRIAQVQKIAFGQAGRQGLPDFSIPELVNAGGIDLWDTS